MFEGADFFAVAKQLSGQVAAPAPESIQRTAIGRAYYACYSAARESFVASQVWQDKKKASHAAVRRAAQKKDPTLASWLDTLRVLREHADYHVWTPSSPSTSSVGPYCFCNWNPDPAANSALALTLAEKVLRKLGKLPPLQ